MYERFIDKSKGVVEENNALDVYVTYVDTQLVTKDLGICEEDLVATYVQWIG